jgi:hypothetical protein
MRNSLCSDWALLYGSTGSLSCAISFFNQVTKRKCAGEHLIQQWRNKNNCLLSQKFAKSNLVAFLAVSQIHIDSEQTQSDAFWKRKIRSDAVYNPSLPRNFSEILFAIRKYNSLCNNLDWLLMCYAQAAPSGFLPTYAVVRKTYDIV